MRIGVDIMGGDYWPQAPIEGAVHAKKELGDAVTIVLIGDEKIIRDELSRHDLPVSDFELVHTDEHIGMEESPTRSIGQKSRSTINVGIGLVKAGKIDGFVSAGNTGAMLVASIVGLGKIAGVNRPTIGVLFPSLGHDLSLVCDVGANVDSKPETLVQFGILGSIFMQTFRQIDNPRVALLNVGEEESKGPAVLQAAHQLMKTESRINFQGNAEGRDIYNGVADVYVCDGYTGNIVLKFGESLYDVLKPRYPSDEFIEEFNFENYGGVPILGIKGISIIGHGISTGKAIAKMIRNAANCAEHDLVGRIEAAFQSIQQQNSTAE